ncbi:Ppx/GppA phosphatase family protein [Brumimicrobium mesophilum]|uniref:Ppx/GppA phosphatase family protein n=1 Tax=Brumimicrobium mesophilum TaxID=392717 RepID=UPI000D14403E|nr:ethanolamine ammonia-lyase reactivating factor EutA [Brumimicrobium mesophilum]
MKFGAIDIGTNATRLLIGEVDFNFTDGLVHKHSYIRIPLRLGVEVFDSGYISESKIIEFKKSMQAFKLVAEVFDVKDLRVCATSAMREAKNALEVKNYIDKEVGLNMEIISGHQEADIIFSTFSLLNKEENASYIVIDVGGGSTEISVFEKGEKINSESFNIGTVRMLKEKVSKQCWLDIKKWLNDNIDVSGEHKVFATGGNINKAHKLLKGQFMKPTSIKKIRKLRNELRKLSLNERINKFNLKPDRADTIVPALDIYLFIIKILKTKSITVPKVGLADGMIYTMYLNSLNE